MADPTQTPQPRRLWRITLFVSLALNVALIGLIVGASMRGGSHARGFDLSFGPIGQALTREQRREIGNALRRNSDIRLAGRKERGERVAALAEVIAAEPFSPDDLRDSLDAIQQRGTDLAATAKEALITQIALMSADERAAFAQRILEGSQRRKGD